MREKEHLWLHPQNPQAVEPEVSVTGTVEQVNSEISMNGTVEEENSDDDIIGPSSHDTLRAL